MRGNSEEYWTDPGGWPVQEKYATETFAPEHTAAANVSHDYKQIYHSTPSHLEFDAVPDEITVRAWPGNPSLAVERFSLFLQAVMGPPDLLTDAASKVLSLSRWHREPNNEAVAAMAVGLDHVLASNGGKAATLTIAVPDTGYPDTRQCVYLRFEKGADTSMEVSRYPDRNVASGRGFLTDASLLRKARQIQKAATSRPTEVELGLESYRSYGGELGIGLEIRDTATITEDFSYEDY